MEFRILGALEVVEAGRAVELGGARRRALLAILLLHRGEVVPMEQLVEELYGQQRPADAGNSIKAHVSRLRKAISGACDLRAAAGGYVLELASGSTVDLDRFDALVETGRSALARDDAEVASRSLAQALDLWRGPPLVDFRYEEFAQAEIGRLEEKRLGVLEDRIEADLALGRHAQVASELERLVAEQPLRERPRRLLMLALYRSGRQVEALDGYAETRRLLADELGLEPSDDLKRLQRAILEHDPSLAAPPLAHAAPEIAAKSAAAFVGRERELEELWAHLDDAFAGRGVLVLISGEPGIGKSRLTDELVRRARRRGARVLVGRCWEAGGAPAYWPWVQSLRAYIRNCPAEILRRQLAAGASDLAQLLPELHELFPDLPAPPAVDSESARFRLFDAAASFLSSAAREQPCVVVIDDLHAADEPSLLLLRFVARELVDSRLLVVAAYRDVDPKLADPLAGTLSELAREPVTRRIPLGGLTEADVGTYIATTIGVEPEAATVSEIHSRTEGNPLFVGEIVRLHAAEGRLEEADGAVRVPPGVRDVIGARVRRLSKPCRDALAAASVLGREFRLDVLARVTAATQDDLLETLDEAMGARVVSEVPGAPHRLRFAHVLIRDTLYEELTGVARIRLHRLAVDALEALHGEEPGAHLAELAYHSIAGSDFEKGVRYAQRAGDHAFELLAHEEAARLYRRALQALDLVRPMDERVRCELLLSLGAAEARAGDISAADEDLLEAASIARRLGLPRELGRAAADYGGRMIWTRGSDAPGLVPLLEEALAGLAEEDVELRARLLARLAGALRDEVSRDRRDELSSLAIDVARRTGNPAALAHALDGRSFAILAPDTLAECLAIGTELRDLAERIGYREGVVNGYMERASALVVFGEIDEVEADLDAARSVADELGQPAQLWDVCGAEAMLALAAGRLSEGERLVERSLELGNRALPAGVTAVYWVQRYTLCDLRGDAEELAPAISDLVAKHPTRPVLRCVLAHLHARIGRLDEARATVDDLARDDFADVPFDQEWLLAMSYLAETSVLLDDTDSASVLYRLLLPWAALNVADQAEAVRGAVGRYLGILAATLNRLDEAEDHFEAALGMNEQMGFRPWLAYTQLDFADMLRRRGRAADVERSRELKRKALALADEIGLAVS